MRYLNAMRNGFKIHMTLPDLYVCTILMPERIRQWNGQRLEALSMDDHASRQMESIEYHPGNGSQTKEVSDRITSMRG